MARQKIHIQKQSLRTLSRPRSLLQKPVPRPLKTIILGVTGGIGMGKSTVAALARGLGVPVFDADRYVHRLLNKGGPGVAPVRAVWPETYDPQGQKINRLALGRLIFREPSARQQLESILHPLVRTAELRFVKRHTTHQTPMAILDIPLLFETKADVFCTAVIVVSAPAPLQRARVLARPNMTPEKFAAIKKAQMPNARRLARADYILDTGGPLSETRRHLQRILKDVQKTHA